MSGDDNSNIERILNRIIDQGEKNNTLLNVRLDKLSDAIEKLQAYHTLIPQHGEKLISIEEDIKEMKVKYSSLRDKIRDLESDSSRREEMKRSVINPLMLKAVWGLMGGLACCSFVAIEFIFEKMYMH